MGFIRIPVSITAPGGRSQDRYEGSFLIDTGAIDSMVPSSALERVGVEPIGRKTYELADGTSKEFPFGIAQIEFLGLITGGLVIFGPENAEPLLGVTALESAGLGVDPATQTLRKLPHALRL